jgi:hypothetical protein
LRAPAAATSPLSRAPVIYISSRSASPAGCCTLQTVTETNALPVGCMNNKTRRWLNPRPSAVVRSPLRCMCFRVLEIAVCGLALQNDRTDFGLMRTPIAARGVSRINDIYAIKCRSSSSDRVPADYVSNGASTLDTVSISCDWLCNRWDAMHDGHCEWRYRTVPGRRRDSSMAASLSTSGELFLTLMSTRFI